MGSARNAGRSATLRWDQIQLDPLRSARLAESLVSPLTPRKGAPKMDHEGRRAMEMVIGILGMVLLGLNYCHETNDGYGVDCN